MNEENLIPMNQRSEEERKLLARKGGIASGITRRNKKNLDNNPLFDEITISLLKEEFKDFDKIKEKVNFAILKTFFSDHLDNKELEQYKIRQKLGRNKRYLVLEKANFKCQACGDKPTKYNDVVLEIDHIIPVSLGGTNNITNLQVLCKRCNESKRNNFFNNLNEEWENGS